MSEHPQTSHSSAFCFAPCRYARISLRSRHQRGGRGALGDALVQHGSAEQLRLRESQEPAARSGLPVGRLLGERALRHRLLKEVRRRQRATEGKELENSARQPAQQPRRQTGMTSQSLIFICHKTLANLAVGCLHM